MFSNFCEMFFRIPVKVDLAFPRALWILSPTTNKLHPEYQLEVDSVPIGRLIAELPIMMFALLINMRRKWMAGVEFVPSPLT